MANYRKPTLQQSIAPNATIIGLEGKVRASQTNNPVGVMNTVANSINKFMVPIMQASERRKKAADATWNKWVGQLGPDVDTEGLNAQQTEIVGLASRNLKNDFLQQYQILNRIKNQQSPEYLDAVSQMNKIIDDFKGLASFKAGHLEKKDLFTENKKQGNYSNQSQKDGSYNTAVEIYGAGVDGNGSQWALADDGKTILYSTSNGFIKPSDIPDTTLVDYKGANEINDMLSRIDNAGIGLTGTKERQLRGKLDIMFTNPSTLNSAIYDGKIQGVTLDIPEEILNGDPAVLKETVINQIVDSSRVNAEEEKERKKQQFSNSNNYNFRLNYSDRMRFKGPDGKVYDRQEGTDGSIRFVDQRGNQYTGNSNELEDLRKNVDVKKAIENAKTNIKTPKDPVAERLEIINKTRNAKNPDGSKKYKTVEEAKAAVNAALAAAGMDPLAE